MPRHPAAEVAYQVDFLPIDEWACIAPAGRRAERPQRHRHQLAALVVDLVDVHMRLLDALGLVDRLVACGGNYPVIKQRASFEVGDFHGRSIVRAFSLRGKFCRHILQTRLWNRFHTFKFLF